MVAQLTALLVRVVHSVSTVFSYCKQALLRYLSFEAVQCSCKCCHALTSAAVAVAATASHSSAMSPLGCVNTACTSLCSDLNCGMLLGITLELPTWYAIT
jgi:hypothetical protein